MNPVDPVIKMTTPTPRSYGGRKQEARKIGTADDPAPWKAILRRAVVSGTVSNALSTLALVAAGQKEQGSPLAPINAISHWCWGNRALRINGPSAQFTVPGYLIHHASSIFWAMAFERLFAGIGARGAQRAIVAAGATAAVACFTDFHLTPRRLTPGFEHRLSKVSLFAVYGAFAAGLAITELVRCRRQYRP